jgi:hypothetical protein
VFNYVNLHACHYAGNNPAVLKDPDGSIITPEAIWDGVSLGIGIVGLLLQLLLIQQWTCSITYFTEPYRVRVIEQVSQNAPHFAVFKRKLFKNRGF